MTHGIGRWDPLVLDTPTIHFEPRPPGPHHRFRPDTACDGWSNSRFTVRAATVRGYAHRYSGSSRQDAVEVRSHPRSQAVAFAVADGVSSAAESELGAAMACWAAVVGILEALDHDPTAIDWTRLVHRVADRMCGLVPGGDPVQVSERFGTTLVAGVVLPRDGDRSGALVQVGDSAAWLLHHGLYRPLFEHPANGGSPVTSSQVVPLPLVPSVIAPVPVSLSSDSVLLVGTDGFGDPLGDGTGLVGQLFADVLRDVPSPLALAHALDFSRETFDDDRTLLAIWPTDGWDGGP